jgi:hypothetical protein
MVIVTPGMTAPLLSVTVPVTSAELVAWPKAMLELKNISMTKNCTRLFMLPP